MKYISQEKIKYLIAGGWNTVVGFGSFVFLYFLLKNSLHYIFILMISQVIGITNAYVSYKFFVFKTKGNYIKEYLRFYVVYGFAFIANLMLLPLFVEILKISPLFSQAVVIIITIIIGFFGHKNFSFSVTTESKS